MRGLTLNGDGEKFGKKLFGDNDIEAVLDRLDRLTPEEAQMTAVQTLMIVHGLVENLRQVMSGERTLICLSCIPCQTRIF